MIEFEEETHTYIVNGKKLPSVTQITNILSNMEYSEVSPEILEKAGERGTKVHKAIEDLTNWNDYELEEKYEDYMLSYKKAKALENITPLEAEVRLTNNEFCGTIDSISKIDNTKIIIDYKTTNIIHMKLLEAQFGGYKILCDYNNIKIDKWYGLFLSKNGYKFIEVKPNIEIFKKCKEIYDYMKEGE